MKTLLLEVLGQTTDPTTLFFSTCYLYLCTSQHMKCCFHFMTNLLNRYGWGEGWGRKERSPSWELLLLEQH